MSDEYKKPITYAEYRALGERAVDLKLTAVDRHSITLGKAAEFIVETIKPLEKKIRLLENADATQLDLMDDLLRRIEALEKQQRGQEP